MTDHAKLCGSLDLCRDCQSSARVDRIDLGGESVMVLQFDLPTRRDVPGLTPAESQLVELIWLGYSTAQMAAHRHASIRTVDNQLAAIYAKAGVATREELVAWIAYVAPPD